MFNNSFCHCISLHKAGNNLTKVYDAALAKVKIKITQFSTLRNIQRLGKTKISDLSHLLKLDRTIVLGNIEKLIKMDIIFYKYGNNNKNKVISKTTIGKTNLEKQLLFGNKLNSNTLKQWG